MYFKSLITLCFTLIFSLNANAALIVDAEFDAGENGLVSDGGWYTTAQQWGYFTEGANPEGDSIAHLTHNSQDVYTHDISNGTLTIQQGTYSIYFAAGNWSNEGFLALDITFAGMNQSLATSSSAQAPGSGQWELWTFTWDVAADSAFIGNALSFNAKAIGSNSNNSAIDGVGKYSDLGNGFLVDYVSAEPVSEPSALALLALGLLGLVSRRFVKR